MAISQSKQRGVRKIVVSTKLDQNTLIKVDQFAKETDSTRSAAVATLIEKGVGGSTIVRDLTKELNALKRKLAKAADVLN